MNEVPEILRKIIRQGCEVRLVEENIYSVLPERGQSHHYDKRSAIYDVVVGMSLYHRVAWGNSSRDYFAFARQAVSGRPHGILFDAGCGSLLFTAQAYTKTEKTIIAFDESLPMLRRARARLKRIAGSVPGNIYLVQGDLFNLPFDERCFTTILTMHVLHVCEDIDTLLRSLNRLLSKDGVMFATSAVANGGLRDLYLAFLHRMGEFAEPRNLGNLTSHFQSCMQQGSTVRMKGGIAYTISDCSPACAQN